MGIELVPISLKQANEFIRLHHRHHGPVVGHKFSVGVSQNGPAGNGLVGVGIAGRPVSRMLDDGKTLEVTRICTNGLKNVPSMLYGALSRAAFALGYTRVLTYVLCTEPGTSLKAAGWECKGPAGGGSWSRPSRRRTDKAPVEKKVRYEIAA